MENNAYLPSGLAGLVERSRRYTRWFRVVVGHADAVPESPLIFVTCSMCGLEMTPGGGCSMETVVLPSGTHARIPLASESSDWWLGRAPDTQCHDCGVAGGRL